MRPLRVADDFVSISTFKARANEYFERASQSGAPLVVTQNGVPAGVVLSPSAFDQLTETARFVEAVKRGLDDVDAGRVVSDAEVERRMRLKLKSLKR